MYAHIAPEACLYTFVNVRRRDCRRACEVMLRIGSTVRCRLAARTERCVKAPLSYQAHTTQHTVVNVNVRHRKVWDRTKMNFQFFGTSSSRWLQGQTVDLLYLPFVVTRAQGRTDTHYSFWRASSSLSLHVSAFRHV